MQKARIKGRIGAVTLTLIFPVILLVAMVTSGLGWPTGLAFFGGSWATIVIVAVASKWAWDYPL